MFLGAHGLTVYYKQFLFFLKTLVRKFLQKILGLIIKNKNGMHQENFHVQNLFQRENEYMEAQISLDTRKSYMGGLYLTLFPIPTFLKLLFSLFP